MIEIFWENIRDINSQIDNCYTKYKIDFDREIIIKETKNYHRKVPKPQI